MALSSFTRISTFCAPTVSIQNGNCTCLRSSLDSARSSKRKNGFGPRRREVAGRQHLHLQIQAVARQLDDLLRTVGFRQILVDVDDGRDVACGGFRQAARHGLPMALHERKGDDAFENDDRRDDDEKGAGVESFGEDLAHDAKKAGGVGMFAKAAIAS